ncbi:MAG: hypothetical protein HYX62_03150 [Gammaproteobacteria bacterium]|nr:hypothetical protein [Gammaproteobacteria bacterium]
MNAYTEDTLVQQSTPDYLDRQLDWKSVYVCNNQDFGSGSFLGCGPARWLYE